MKFNTIHSIESVIIKDKQSKFIGYAYPIYSELEAKEKIEAIKAQHPKATHHCYAYKLGFDNNNYRANDDGEPNGTAGKPILNQINSLGLTNCLVIVVRYFGGTKLGVSGLIDAYKLCAKETLAATTIDEREIISTFNFEVAFELTNQVFDYLNKKQYTYTKTFTKSNIQFNVQITKELEDTLINFLAQKQIEFSVE
ncbi:MAG TPA: YigZ family protein [Chitinophagales bacterium]|nr:YigZ family protein [Chitinophagales bacterium]HMU98008.1 YigZ family protein [Chitinophagales bacterium]HMV02635.1 YigZ family protein [Chitinophagales bacterium]HMW94429.1 YigZ family protein [Chitinophagales bacterium]HMY41508.1 YigZ family protein [Chitinophagales bacterium]